MPSRGLWFEKMQLYHLSISLNLVGNTVGGSQRFPITNIIPSCPQMPNSDREEHAFPLGRSPKEVEQPSFDTGGMLPPQLHTVSLFNFTPDLMSILTSKEDVISRLSSIVHTTQLADVGMWRPHICCPVGKQSWARLHKFTFIFPGALIAHRHLQRTESAAVAELVSPPLLLLSRKNLFVLAKL
jgi:hypothetical protein